MRGTVLRRVDEVERDKETLRLKDTGLEVLHGVLCRWDGLSLTLMLPTAVGLARDDNGQWLLGFRIDVGQSTTHYRAYGRRLK